MKKLILLAVALFIVTAYPSSVISWLRIVGSDGIVKTNNIPMLIDVSTIGYTNKVSYINIRVKDIIYDFQNNIFKYPYTIGLFSSTKEKAFVTYGLTMKQSDSTPMTEDDFVNYLVEWRDFTIKNRIEIKDKKGDF